MIKQYKCEELDIIEVLYENLEVKLSSLGAGIVNINYVDKFGIKESVVAQPLDPLEYLGNDAYYGKICGRTSGRIDKGIFTLNNKKYNLDINWNDVSNLHGGFTGISEKNWTVEEVLELDDKTIVEFSTISLDKESGFPGNLIVNVVYTITCDSIEIDYYAICDEDTLCNLTNHTYFNLSGNCKDTMLEHELEIKADRYTNLNNELITTSVEEVNKVFDFRVSKKIKTDIFDESIKNHTAYGYDHAFIFEKQDKNISNVIYKDKKSGRILEVFTTYPCVVIYACCYPSGHIVSSNKPIELHQSICLECQNVPNGINMNDVDKSILLKNEKYYQKTVYKFSVEL